MTQGGDDQIKILVNDEEPAEEIQGPKKRKKMRKRAASKKSGSNNRDSYQDNSVSSHQNKAKDDILLFGTEGVNDNSERIEPSELPGTKKKVKKRVVKNKNGQI